MQSQSGGLRSPLAKFPFASAASADPVPSGNPGRRANHAEYFAIHLSLKTGGKAGSAVSTYINSETASGGSRASSGAGEAGHLAACVRSGTSGTGTGCWGSELGTGCGWADSVTGLAAAGSGNGWDAATGCEATGCAAGCWATNGVACIGAGRVAAAVIGIRIPPPGAVAVDVIVSDANPDVGAMGDTMSAGAVGSITCTAGCKPGTG